jgi:hypothetical protein
MTSRARHSTTGDFYAEGLIYIQFTTMFTFFEPCIVIQLYNINQQNASFLNHKTETSGSKL